MHSAVLTLPAIPDIEEAARFLAALVPPTPQFTWPLVNERLGAEVWIKHENHTPVGAFKIRSALTCVRGICSSDAPVTHLIAATRGNWGQGLAFAARHFGLQLTVVVPHGNSASKNLAMKAWGAELIEYGTDFQDAFECAGRLASERSWTMVPSFSPSILLGAATYTFELLETAPPLDILYVPIGMGSSICGAAAARNALSPQTRIVGVVSSNALAHKLSFEKGRLVSNEVSPTVADGLACRTPVAEVVEILCREVDRVVAVTDEEIRAAMRAIFADTHNVAEGAGAAAFAAATAERDTLDGKRIGIMLTGGNVDSDVFAGTLRPSASS